MRRVARAFDSWIRIRGARQHNLQNVDVELPRDALVVVTGVSGSGKSSLAFATLFREGQRRFWASFSAHARTLMGKTDRPRVEAIEGLLPAIAVDQNTVVRSPRSTVGTLSGLYDLLRLLYARLGRGAEHLTASCFSFNSPAGACPACGGLGVEDRIDPELLIADPERTIRQGALRITTPKGYLVYSQVTLDVLDRVCRAHGFDIDIPWQQLSDAQRRVVLQGSDRIRIPYGKHPLESRLKWQGMTARPREEGFYKGILPVMEQILARSRNANIMRFARSRPCRACDGGRLRPEALAVTLGGENIAAAATRAVLDLPPFCRAAVAEHPHGAIGRPLLAEMERRTALLEDLGLGHLTLGRASSSLAGGEAQRLRLANQVSGRLTDVLYVLDEPSVGLHPSDHGRLLDCLARLRDAGNTVVVVEHDEQTMRRADWLVDVGPGAGPAGGAVVYSGPPAAIDRSAGAAAGATAALLSGAETLALPRDRRPGIGLLRVVGARAHNLRAVQADFKLGALNAVSGVSGAGKTSLVDAVLGRALARRLHGAGAEPGDCDRIEGAEALDKVIVIDQAPIGRTPRSNPATYTKLFDAVRALFAATPEAAARGLGKGHFSFNQKGGRCEDCQGAGVLRVGMHFMADVEVACPACQGRRFDAQTLAVTYRGKSIHDVLEMPVQQAAEFFARQSKVARPLEALRDIGLGYLPLGRPATSLSGGEAQRIKLAAQLGRPATGRTLYILDEPSTGLHRADVRVLLRALGRLVAAGNTVIVIEHDLDLIAAADRVIDLGPGGGGAGGRIVACGTPEEIAAQRDSATGACLRPVLAGAAAAADERRPRAGAAAGPDARPAAERTIAIRGARANNLRGVDVDIPRGRITVVTGVSGSGKSSLAYDTVYAEGRRRFAESLSARARRHLERLPAPEVERISGLGAVIAVRQQRLAENPRSTVATATDIHHLLRLVYSRAGLWPDSGAPCGLSARDFSFNHHRGACARCDGLGAITVCDADALISHPQRSLFAGAMDGHPAGRHYGERGGQQLAVLEAVGRELGMDFARPWVELDAAARRVALHGVPERTFDAVWRYDRRGRRGSHRWQAPWPGFAGHVEQEYARVHADHRGRRLRAVMKDEPCPDCRGQRLAPGPRQVEFGGRTLGDLLALPVAAARAWLAEVLAAPDRFGLGPTRAGAAAGPLQEIVKRLEALERLGLSYLALERSMASLSGGEAQRTRLAAQLGIGLSGITYVLDEPSCGLHPRDSGRLLAVLRQLARRDNTLLLVEHDAQLMAAADAIIELGPGAGERGGRLVAQGPPAAIRACRASLSGQILRGERAGGRPARKRTPPSGSAPGLVIEGACAHNLADIDVQLPTGALIAVSGVSGSGKTSLVFDALLPSLENGRPVGCRRLRGAERFGAVAAVDQRPIGTTPASTPATYSGLFDPIRAVFAGLDAARERGLGKAHFSFNSKKGRCTACGGMGQLKVEMGFLADQWLPCEACHGARYRPEVLAVAFGGASIAEVLAMSVDRAAAHFAGCDDLVRGLETLSRLGLGYLALGQSATSLSGGEAQRLKLAAELIGAGGRGDADRPKLYLLDEPTRGLHARDVDRLLALLHQLADAGHTVLVIEHDLDLIAAADAVIDLGPEAGAAGGRIVAQGPPQAIAACAQSHTGRALRAR